MLEASLATQINGHLVFLHVGHVFVIGPIIACAKPFTEQNIRIELKFQAK